MGFFSASADKRNNSSSKTDSMHIDTLVLLKERLKKLDQYSSGRWIKSDKQLKRSRTLRNKLLEQENILLGGTNCTWTAGQLSYRPEVISDDPQMLEDRGPDLRCLAN